jgi:cobalt-zinc-cadmium efflux system membrane fusion protein
VNADAIVAATNAPLVLPMSALQTFRNWTVVFLKAGETYQAQPVELGNSDGKNVAITSGLTAGMSVVITNSYLIKADIEKSGASHDH